MVSKNIVGWVLVLLASLCETYAALTAKLRFNEVGDIDFNSLALFTEYVGVFFQSPLLLTGLIAFFLAPVAWFLALNRIELSIGYPVLVILHLVFGGIFAVSFLGEAFNLSKLIGFAFVLLSLYFFRKAVGVYT